MSKQVDLDALIADSREWVQLHRENKYQREAAKRMTVVLDALESALAELRQERERTDELEANLILAGATVSDVLSALSRAEETIEAIRTWWMGEDAPKVTHRQHVAMKTILTEYDKQKEADRAN